MKEEAQKSDFLRALKQTASSSQQNGKEATSDKQQGFSACADEL
jgi:hypothetical protein